MKIYADNAATTRVSQSALNAMLPYFTEKFENPSAPYARARAVKSEVEQARGRIAQAMGAKPGNITFTAGATEANNLAFAAVDGQVLCSAIEHDSVLACARTHDYALLGVDSQGIVSPDTLAAAITPRTELVSIALANGEIGTIQPLRELAGVIQRERQRRLDAGDARPIWLHTDASQAACTHSLNVSSLGADLITVSAAKIYGPKQVGLLWARDGIALRPLVHGGGQEGGARSGTENTAGIVGFATALELACSERKTYARDVGKLRDLLQRELASAFPQAIVFGPRKSSMRLESLLGIAFPGIEARRLVIALDRRGVSVGTGAACAASKMKTSHVLEAIGAPDEALDASLRITLGRSTTREQVTRAAELIIETVKAEYDRTGNASA